MTPRPIGTFCWSDLGTTNAEAAKAFYAALCGWTYTDIPMGDAGTYTMVHAAGHEIGGLYALAGPMFEGVPSHFLFYVRVADVDATVGRCAELGGRVEMPGHDIPERGRMAMLADPAGARFAIYEGRGHDGTAVPEDAAGVFCWHELQTRDPEGAVGFYRELFGWSAKVDGGAQPYTEFSLGVGDRAFAGMIKMDERWGEAPPSWMGYLNVADCDAAAQQVVSLGGTQFVPPTDIPNVGRFAVLADPTGAMFAIIRLGAAAAG